MKVLIVTSEFPPGPGGIGHHAYQLARHLSKRHWQVIVVACQDYAHADEILNFNRAQEYPIVRLDSIPGPLIEGVYRLIKYFSAIRKYQPDVILSSGQKAVWLAALCGFLSHRPWIAVGHGTEFGDKNPLSCYLNRLSYAAADCLISVSNYTQNWLQAKGIKAKRHEVIYNGADEDFFYPLKIDQIQYWKQQHGLDKGYILLTVGNVTERKGQEVVIRALPYILKVIPEVHYIIVGLPTLKDKLTKLATELQVSERVHFLGKASSETLLYAYNACDLFVMTSRLTRVGDFEGFGIAVIEAALCGKPAIVSQNCGLAEAVKHGYTGLTVPQNAPEITAAAIVELLRDDGFRKYLGQNARQRALQELTWSRCAEKYDQILRSLI